MLVFFAFITVFTDYKQSKLSDGLDPHFEIPLQTLETEGGGYLLKLWMNAALKSETEQEEIGVAPAGSPSRTL